MKFRILCSDFVVGVWGVSEVCNELETVGRITCIYVR